MTLNEQIERAPLEIALEAAKQEIARLRREVQEVRETSNRRKADMYKANRWHEAAQGRARDLTVEVTRLTEQRDAQRAENILLATKAYEYQEVLRAEIAILRQARRFVHEEYNMTWDDRVEAASVEFLSDLTDPWDCFGPEWEEKLGLASGDEDQFDAAEIRLRPRIERVLRAAFPEFASAMEAREGQDAEQPDP